MKVDGIHHVTAITADVEANLAFYARLLGLRLSVLQYVVVVLFSALAITPGVHLPTGRESGTFGTEGGDITPDRAWST